MDSGMERVWSVAPPRMYLHRAADAVDTLVAELSGTPLSPELRRELAAGTAALLGKLELLQGMLRRNDSPDSHQVPGLRPAS
jgi:hypothetical protein